MLMELYKIAREFKGSPAEMQTLLKKIDNRVVSVGDDLSFVLRFDREIKIDEDVIKALGGKSWKLYPFRRAYKFNRGYIAIDGRFLRISRDVDEKVIAKIQEIL